MIVAAFVSGTVSGWLPKSSEAGPLKTGTGGPASSPATVNRLVDDPPGPATTKLLPLVPPVTVCGVRPSPMWLGGRPGSGVQVRNGPIWPPSAPPNVGHGASEQPVSVVLRPPPVPSV